MQMLFIFFLLGFAVECQHIGNSSSLSNFQSEGNDSEQQSENVTEKLTTLPENVTTNPPALQTITVPPLKDATTISTSDKDEAQHNTLSETEKKKGSVARKGVEDGPLPTMAPVSTGSKVSTTSSTPTLEVQSGEIEEQQEGVSQESSVEDKDDKTDTSSHERETSKEEDEDTSNENLATKKLHPKKVENGTVSSVLSPKTPFMKPKTASSDSEALSTNSALIASILIVIVLCCFAGIAYFKLVKRGISRRHYERVDFLIEGMYDDDL